MYHYHPASLLSNEYFTVEHDKIKKQLLDDSNISEEQFITICGGLYGAMAAIVEESECMEMAMSIILDHVSLFLQQNYVKNKLIYEKLWEI